MSSPTPPDEMTAAQRFAEVINRLATERGFDLEHGGTGRARLAEAMDVSVWTVGRWLKGETLPGPNYYGGISRALGVDPKDLLRDAGILPSEDHTDGANLPVPSPNRPVSPETACDLMGITDPTLRDMLIPGMERAQRLQRQINRHGASKGTSVARG